VQLLHLQNKLFPSHTSILSPRSGAFDNAISTQHLEIFSFKMEINYILLAQIPIYVVCIWIFTVYMVQTFPCLTGKRILLLIAHPDDEAMFFAPTLRRLSDRSLGNQIFLLCLSSGDADGLGHIRKSELKESALQLGITHPDHVVVIEDAKFPDSMTESWDAKAIANILTRYFAPDLASTPSNTAPKALIDAIITFDKGGVSGHPNHISLLQGAIAFLRTMMQRHTGWECPVKLYTLTTTNLLRKYSSIIDSATTVITCLWRTKDRGQFPTPILAVSGVGDVRKAQRAMTTAHKSQMRWFRWGWIGVSRYMVVNDLNRVRVV
jgi:N-acetylglucosaminylphosphatidylinositol deacetylase